MSAQSADPIQIREYLLGNVPEDDCKEIEVKLLTDAEFAKAVELVEDDIIEDYLEGNLSPSEKQKVESHFLRPPERKRKLWFVRLLRSHAAPGPPVRRRWFPYALNNWKMPGGLAALSFLSILLGIHHLTLRREL